MEYLKVRFRTISLSEKAKQLVEAAKESLSEKHPSSPIPSTLNHVRT